MSRDRDERTRPCEVWIANHYADAPDRPAGTRHHDLARQLVARGRRVTIFAASFSHVTGRDERLKGRRFYRVERFEGVQFVWLRTFPYRGNTWRRQINMLSYLAMFLVVQIRFPKPDVVIGSTVHPFAAIGAWLTATLRRARFLFEVRDLWPQTLVDLGAMRSGSMGERFLRTIEAFLVRRASTVLTLLPGMRDYLIERRLPAEHVVYIPNGVDIRAFDEAASGADRDAALVECLEGIRRLRDDGRLVIGYVGSFGRVNDVGIILRAAELAETRAPGRIGLILIGDGPERPELVRVLGVARFAAFGPPVAKRHVPAVLRAVDAGVVHATSTPVYRYGISFNKLFEYMAAERPVVFACDSAYDPVMSHDAGMTVSPDDSSLLADAFIELADAGPDVRASMGASGRRYVAVEHNIERLGATLDALVGCDRAT